MSCNYSKKDKKTYGMKTKNSSKKTKTTVPGHYVTRKGKQVWISTYIRYN